MKSILLVSALFLVALSPVYGQVYSDKVLNERRKAEVDSVASDPYPYLLPIWGEKVIERGFDIPYSAGLSVNYLYQESDITVNNLQVGFNGGELIDLDEFINFPSAVAESNAVNFRPDFWLFPFLDLYGILAKVQSSTAITASLSLPNQDGFEDITEFSTKAEFSGTTVGFGITPTIGVGGGWFALDMNFSWTDIPELDKPVYTFVFGPRLGKTFHFKKPEQNLAVWVGGFRIAINNTTAGSLKFNDLFGGSGDLEERIALGMEKVVEKQMDVDDWYNSLTPAEQILNRPKYEAINRILGAANNFLFRLEDARQNVLDSTVQYSIEKKQKNLWNFLVGAQYQINKNFMIRAEYGFLASRTQFIGGLQYRFRL